MELLSGIVVVQNGTVKSNADLVKTLNDATVPGTDVVGEWQRVRLKLVQWCREGTRMFLLPF